MFPLGAVLFPHMPLQLQIFEPRYRRMLADLLASKDLRFGVVLIERGQEVGGGEHRFDHGVVAEVLDLDADNGLIRIAAVGRERFSVRGWVPDDPYPVAEVEERPALVWDDALTAEFVETEALVRSALVRSSEFSERQWPADIQLSDDPLEAAWQLAAIAPLTALDQARLLEVESASELISRTRVLTAEADVGFG